MTVHEWMQFFKNKLFEFDEHILVVIVLKKIIPKSSTLSLAKLNLCSCRHKITEYVTFELVSCFYVPTILRSTKIIVICTLNNKWPFSYSLGRPYIISKQHVII